VTGLRTDDLEENRFAVIMRAVYGLVTRFNGRAAHATPVYLSDPYSTQEQVTVWTVSRIEP
jgi:hypothetical protein